MNSFVYKNLYNVYQNRLKEIRIQQTLDLQEHIKNLDDLKQQFQFASEHCQNRCIRIDENIHKIKSQIDYLQNDGLVQDFLAKTQTQLIAIQEQTLKNTDIESFYETLGVIYRPNVYEFENKNIKNSNAVKIDRNICQNCNVPRFHDEYEAFSICPNCNNCIHFQRDSNDPDETMQYTIQFEYERLNHLRECLNQIIKAEDSANTIPNHVIRGIKRQILKERIKNRSMITPKRIREWLKRDLKMSKYSEKVYSILFRICKIRPPKIPKALEEKFYEMFEQVNKPFAKHVPHGRVHFFNYFYLLRKFSELLDQRHLLHIFKILKGTDRVHFQDEIWKKCCAELGWKFIPSI